MNIGKMILDKNKKLINQCNVLGGLGCLYLIHTRDAAFVELLLRELRLLHVFA